MFENMSTLVDKYFELQNAIRKEEQNCKDKTKVLCLTFEKETSVCLIYPEMVQVEVAIDFKKTKERKKAKRESE